MRFDPMIVVRSTLGMCFLMILACLALTRGVTEVKAESEVENALVESSAEAASNAPAEETDCRVSDRYPEEVRRWCGLITRYAEQANLSPDLVAGLIWYESGGDPMAYSRSGAVGLMQVMPRDGIAAEFQCANGPCFASRPSTAELQDAEFNIQYGTRMLAGLYARHQDMRQALRAYGPMDVGYTYADKLLAIYGRYGEN